MYLLADRDWIGFSHLVAGLVLCAAAVALLCVSIGGDSSAGDAAPVTIVPSAPPRPAIAVRNERAGRSFEAAGVSFRVIADPNRAWANQVDRPARGRAQQVLAVAVDVVNVHRRGFDPGLLPYLLRGPRGQLFAPVRAGAVGPNSLARKGGLPRGAAAEERLVFSLPAGLRRKLLVIQPVPTRALEVRVPLAG
ncbi:MAG TPA: hypothetical protein VGO24_05355 [Solirubrobacterales bacterium]|nr:hypothetical protein [Solirubrobacterales bacterium]